MIQLVYRYATEAKTKIAQLKHTAWKCYTKFRNYLLGDIFLAWKGSKTLLITENKVMHVCCLTRRIENSDQEILIYTVISKSSVCCEQNLLAWEPKNTSNTLKIQIKNTDKEMTRNSSARSAEPISPEIL